MATLPHPHVPRLSLSRGGRRTATNHGLPAAARVQQPSAREATARPPVPSERRPSRAASIVPVLLSLCGLFALVLGAAYVALESIELVTSVLSAG